jgi:hypothetical protein
MLMGAGNSFLALLVVASDSQDSTVGVAYEEVEAEHIQPKEVAALEEVEREALTKGEGFRLEELAFKGLKKEWEEVSLKLQPVKH